jgi:hypothetical protein
VDLKLYGARITIYHRMSYGWNDRPRESTGYNQKGQYAKKQKSCKVRDRKTTQDELYLSSLKEIK